MIPSPEEDTDSAAWGIVIVLVVICWLAFGLALAALGCWPWGRI